jgi:hypothetical protein
MKFKITLLIMAGITLISFNSCFVRVGGHARVPRVHHERHGRGPHTYVQPENNGLKNSFAVPLITPSFSTTLSQSFYHVEL